MTIAVGQVEDLSPTKRALLAIKDLQTKLDALERAKHEPIAMIGMGCRFPGGVDNPEAFWTLLRDGVDAITEVPGDRWNIDHYYSPDPEAPGKICTRHGGFVPHLHEFDARFFRIAPREALSLDPQQRLLLEVSWEALEQAALAPEQLIDRQAGVFVGICSIDYWHRLLARPDREIDAYLTTGNTHSIAAGRLSYLLGLTGPSLAIDTACSSSLVAVHLACQSLRNEECDLALAGGVNRILSPETSINFSKARMLSPEGRCRSFDAAANGFVRAEGCGVIVLKRLRDAVADGDRILAVILGSAVNHDGRTSGLTVPNGPAQHAVICQALSRSRLDPSQVSYVEAHGTGTALGDPIEVNTLGQVYGEGRSPTQPLRIGSVKTNIGHSEAAAGVAGLIKVVLALQHQEIPANLHFQTPNPHICWQALPIQVPTCRLPWPKGETPRIAGISAFGFSGTNAHLIVAEPPELEPVSQPDVKADRPLHLLTLSARTEAALQQLARRYQQHLAAHPLNLGDICFTANTGRSHFNYRLAIVAATIEELHNKLSAFAAGALPEGVFHGKAQSDRPPSEALIEIGGESPDSKAIYLSLSEDLGTRLADLRLDLEDWRQLLYRFANLYIQGTSINWVEFDRPYGRRKVELPTYPFQRQRYSIEP